MTKAKQAKKTVRKVARSKPAKRKRPSKSEDITLRRVDPFHLDERLIPVGWVYQWAIVGGERQPGWAEVPYSRHAHDFPPSFNFQGYIAHKGLVLVEATVAHAAAERNIPRARAMQMHDNHPASWRSGEGDSFPIMPASWVESEKIPDGAEQNEGPPVEVDVTLKMRVPVRWRSAAAFLNIPLEEYTRRRILMERSILGCIEPFEDEAVYEPVNLKFTPTKEA